METLAAILAEAGPGTLALIDEIGGATDPEEGSALAVAFLEAYLESGGRALATTHLSGVKNFAGSRPDALCAAMEFDEKTGRPNYRLHPGLAGRSRAISVAREQGIPEAVLARARRDPRRSVGAARARGERRRAGPRADPPAGGGARPGTRRGRPRGRAARSRAAKPGRGESEDAGRGARRIRAGAAGARAAR